MNPEIPDAGELAPDFTALTSGAASFSLKEALGLGGNILLLFYRGHW